MKGCAFRLCTAKGNKVTIGKTLSGFLFEYPKDTSQLEISFGGSVKKVGTLI